MDLRKAVFAGSWYPADAAECERQIKGFLQDDGIRSVTGGPWTGGIVPHAGWYYSGSIACNVIRGLQDGPAPDVIVIFGMHLHPRSPFFMTAKGAWETPFGNLPIEEGIAAELLQKYTFQVETPTVFTQDNTIELQLPFIKYFFKDARILPLGVPPDPRSLALGRTVVELAKGLGLKLKVIGSTDLTHYGRNYGFSPKGHGQKAVDWVKEENDRRIIDAMVAMAPEQVIAEASASQNACCAGAAATAIETAKTLGARKAEVVSYRTSYDKSPSDSFVGYVGILM